MNEYSVAAVMANLWFEFLAYKNYHRLQRNIEHLMCAMKDIGEGPYTQTSREILCASTRVSKPKVMIYLLGLPVCLYQ